MQSNLHASAVDQRLDMLFLVGIIQIVLTDWEDDDMHFLVILCPSPPQEGQTSCSTRTKVNYYLRAEKCIIEFLLCTFLRALSRPQPFLLSQD